MTNNRVYTYFAPWSKYVWRKRERTRNAWRTI